MWNTLGCLANERLPNSTARDCKKLNCRVLKKKLIFLSAYLPSPTSKQAGQKTAYRHLKWLAERYDVWFVGFCNEADNPNDESGLREICREVYLYPVTRFSRLLGVLCRLDLPLLVGVRWSLSAARTVQRLEKENKFGRAHAEWSQMADYLRLLPMVPEKWVSVHDVVAQFCDRAVFSAKGWRRWLWLCETARARRWEATCYMRVGTVLVQSAKDAGILKSVLKEFSCRIRVVPPHFERYTARLRTVNAAGPTLLFWGALARAENSEAALWLCRNLMPALWEHLPEARLIVAGSQPSKAVQGFASERIEVTGFVADPQTVFDRSDVAVLPLFRGAGIKVKVLECLAAGLPVLTGSIGAEGILANESDGLVIIEPDPEDYASSLAAWWQNNARLQTLSQGALSWGQRLASGNHSVFID